VLSGKKKSKVAEAKEFLEVGAPRKGPFHYRRPDRILRKTVRGMLPFKQPKGKQAYKKLKVFIGVPEDFKGQHMITLKEAQAAKLKGPYFTLAELAKEIGWNQGE
jgi:large subunit ribosomal protein L13